MQLSPVPYNEGPPYSVGSPQPSSSSPDSTDTPAQDDEGLPRLGAAAADVQLINDDGTRKPSASSPVSSPSLRPVQPSTLSSPEVPDESTAPVQISAQEPSPSVFLGDGHSPSMQSPASSPSSDGQLADSSSSPEADGCEESTLSQLGSTSSYESTGYSLNITWQPQYTSLWQSLGCLLSVQSLRLSGSLPQLPDAGSFPMLKELYIDLPSEGPGLTGSLPSSWGQSTAFPFLTTLSIASTDLTGTVPTSWAVLVSVLEVLHLLTPNLQGACSACF